MDQRIRFGCLVLLACFCWEVSSRPNNDSPNVFKIKVPVEDLTEQNEDQYEERSLPEYETVPEPQVEKTQDIMEKINEINAKLRKPQRQKQHFNAPLYTGGPYILDKAILEKIQEIISSGKLHSNKQKDSIEVKRGGTSKSLEFLQPEITSNAFVGQPVAMMPLSYMVNIPVLVTPTSMTGYASNNDLNSIEATSQYTTRQRPSLPFQIQWPLAPFFPVLIKDPLLHYLQGGTWQTLVDYGQNADVCTRKQKSAEASEESDNAETAEERETDKLLYDSILLNTFNSGSSRQGRKMKNIKKRTVSKSSSQQAVEGKHSAKKVSQHAKSSPLQNYNDVKQLQNIFKKSTTTQKPVNKVHNNDDDDADGKLRFPFGDFNFFGARKPIAPSPGFFINRLKVRRGGVAIAGPGGVATAGRGGTAVVGPGGLAYTQPGGLAVAGPAARVVALSSEADLNSIISRLQQQASTDGSVPRLLQAVPEGKIVATGPVVYYHPYKV